MIPLTCPLSERAIKARFRLLVCGGRTRCSRCHNCHVRWLEKEERYWCPRCRRRFSLVSGTWLHGMKISWQTLYLLLDCWLNAYDVKQTSELSSLSPKMVRKWFRRFRTHIPQNTEYFQGNVEADESWFGYRSGARIQAAWRKVKIPVLGLYERETGLLKTKSVPRPTEEHLIPFVTRNIVGGAHVISDSYRSYWQLPDLGYEHTRVDHYNREYAPTNRIEGSWSVLKRKLRKLYYSVSREKFPEYLCEITYRFNTRKSRPKPLEFLTDTINFENRTT